MKRIVKLVIFTVLYFLLFFTTIFSVCTELMTQPNTLLNILGLLSLIACSCVGIFLLGKTGVEIYEEISAWNSDVDDNP